MAKARLAAARIKVPTPKPQLSLPTRELAGAALIFTAVFIAYFPALNGSLLWDDNAHVTRPELRSLHGLWRIWFDVGATQQYYPLLHTAFWVEHHLWGDAVLGYHLTNLVLHAVAACLVVLIVRRLSVPGAWLAGFVFALHPVCVEAVAWISEQKSTLSAVFYLGAAFVYLRFDQSRRKLSYFLALLLFVLALLTKTVTATLPAALLVVLWWQRGRLSWRKDVLPLVPWVVLGAGFGLFTARVERNVLGATGPDYSLTLLQRCLLAGRAIWFYLVKLLWPVNLIFTYPHWSIDSAAAWQYAFPVGVLALAAALLLIARRHRGPLAGFLFFAGTLFPALGFFNVYPFVYSYVADHFQYLATLGIIVPVACGLEIARKRLPNGSFWQNAIPVALAMILGIGTWRQSGIYRDAETLYRETLARNPGSWMAHNNLGNELSTKPGSLPEAIAHFQEALRLKPDSERAQYNLGLALSKFPDRTPEAIVHYEAALRIKPDYPEAENNLGAALAQVPGRLPEAITYLEGALRTRSDYAEAHNNLGIALSRMPGRLPDAIHEYEAALAINPEYAEAHNNLGAALSDIPERASDAISHFERALERNSNYAEAHENLGNTLANIPGRLPEAVTHFEAALRINPEYAEAHNSLGSALSNLPGRLNEAIAEYEAALRINPEYADAHNNLGVALSQTPGRLPEAIRHFQAALRINPQSAEVHCNLGSALSEIPGRLPDAIAEFQTALRIRPDLDAARQMIARLRAAHGR